MGIDIYKSKYIGSALRRYLHFNFFFFFLSKQRKRRRRENRWNEAREDEQQQPRKEVRSDICIELLRLKCRRCRCVNESVFMNFIASARSSVPSLSLFLNLARFAAHCQLLANPLFLEKNFVSVQSCVCVSAIPSVKIDRHWAACVRPGGSILPYRAEMKHTSNLYGWNSRSANHKHQLNARRIERTEQGSAKNAENILYLRNNR